MTVKVILGAAAELNFVILRGDSYEYTAIFI